MLRTILETQYESDLNQNSAESRKLVPETPTRTSELAQQLRNEYSQIRHYRTTQGILSRTRYTEEDKQLLENIMADIAAAQARIVTLVASMANEATQVAGIRPIQTRVQSCFQQT